MFGLELKIFDRGTAADGTAGADDSATAYFVRSYMRMRFSIGLLAFILPWLLIVVDWLLITSGHQIRGSMSAYYHSPARDLFVGGLVATGGFLVSYMAAKPRTYDFCLSTLAGVLVWVVAAFPTGRSLDTPHFEVSADSCRRFTGPPGCNALQETFGEFDVRIVHGVSAALFVVLLAALCVVFALRQFGYGPAAEQLCGPDRDVWKVLARLREDGVSVPAYLAGALTVPAHARNEAVVSRRRVVVHLALAVAILVSGAWATLGVAVPVPFTGYSLGPTYLGEVGAFLSFGVAWMVAGRELRSGRAVTPVEEPPEEAAQGSAPEPDEGAAAGLPAPQA